MKHGSLFSGGCDGFSLAAKWAGWQTVFQVEQNEFRKNTLAKNFPEAKRYGDIKRFDAKPCEMKNSQQRETLSSRKSHTKFSKQ